MLKKLLFLLLPCIGFSQGYTSYFTGNTSNTTTNPEFGVCLMGGATEHDEAMKWLLQKANGGDVVVLRSSGSNGYNNYLYSELGITVNSVETLVITSVAGATNPYVLDKVANAEMIWFAGGDQWNYVSYFKDNALEDLLNNHINVKQAPIGGTSAGMAILSGRYFSAQNGSITSAQALANPFHPNVTLGGYTGMPGSDFLNVPFLGNVITDTHYDNPDRRGRQFTFLARFKNSGVLTYGIACNEYVAVCIGSDGIAKVYGDYPAYQEFAYFIQPNCAWWNTVENCQSGQPLTWNFGGAAVKAYKVPGTMNGANSFDLNNWMAANGSGGSWENWSVTNGVFTAVPGNSPGPECMLGSADFNEGSVVLYPNPVNDMLYVDKLLNFSYIVYDSQGKSVLAKDSINSDAIDVSGLPNGIYLIKFNAGEKQFSGKIAKQ